MNSPARRRSWRAFTATAIAAGLLATAAAPAAAASAPEPVLRGALAAAADDVATELRSSFILPVIPDTQFYSRYSASQFYPKYDTNPFEVQTDWIVENKEELNIPFAVHVGDVVDQEWVTGEWDAAAKAMKILTDGGVPYSVVPGNHDVANMNARSSEANSWQYLQRFDKGRMQAQGGSTFVDSFQNGLSTAYIFEAEGHQWMSLALAWNASADTFAWAQGVLDAHPGIPVVLSSHAIINIDLDQTSPADWWWGEELWNHLIRKNDEIVVTVNGHFHGTTMRQRTNDFGHPVYQVLTDYQMAADGGNGYMTLFEFDLTNDRIDVESVSPWVTVKDKESLTANDTPVLDGPWQSFSMAVDFEGRFGYKPAEATQGDLSERAKEIVSEGWDGDGVGEHWAAAGRADDYIDVDGTVAHWRFGSVAEGVVDETTVIPDVAGASPMYRSAIDNTDAPEKLEDVQVSHKNVPFYSADRGAVCFSDVHRNATGPDNMSYISTEYGAPATFADLDSSSGYTVEAFLQLDEDWTEAANRWSAALTRGGARQWIGVNDSSDPGAGAAWLGISSLREYQFSAGDTDTRNSYTLWSGEIMQGSWHHVAIVNDPVADTVIMYVDGVPVLRNASKVGGMMAADFMPWIIGASTWNTEVEHGWHGCVGETRVVDHALASSEFLYQRVDLDASLAVTTDLVTVRPSDAVVSSLEGTGHAGASVSVSVDGAAAGSVVVGADGSWSLPLTSPIAGSGSHELSFVQSIGTRSGEAFEGVLVIGESTAWTPDEADLVPSLEGVVTVDPSRFAPGATVKISLPEGRDGESVYGFLFSTPTALGSASVSGTTATLTVPASVPFGEHRFALYAADGTLIGWDAVTVFDPDALTPGGSGAGSDAGGDPLATTGLDAQWMLLWIALGAGVIALGITLVLRRRRA
ncbi:LamG-like jellyroll fold domain-containing protein [Microbacterium phyllosphaerae]|uniref:LamG-like jellyroll fold domain-containing protein n=1 Tax=Microbacterium phyllosphaerae TaxID=124798 RepID=UPI0021670540|nr:LamG-like jellyroll fold domain-containing protein [Microbacterium phyllosphaerae]MCS3442833.1 3',5'-cyclic AMP phosphodiesterase CpdA [Microbacterium phyllosphaerae]